MRTAIYLAVLALTSVLAVGCGQKGPLERPQETDTAVSAAEESARGTSD